MSKRSHRFRATVEVPELGTVEVRGLSPAALRDLPLDPPADMPKEGDVSTADHPIYIAIIAAGCIRPRLSEAQILALPPTSRELLADTIMKAHPAGREKYLRNKGR
jgi:hypothetical protein